jgi:MFS family permease
MSVVSVPLVAIDVLHASPFAIGLLQAAASLPWLLFGLHAGAWIDRRRKLPILLTSHIVAFVMFASVPLVAWAGGLTVAQLVIVEFLAGVSAVFYITAYVPYLPTVVPKEDRVEANAKLHGTASAARVVGPSVGGGVAQLFGPLLGVLGNALSFAVSAFTLLKIGAKEPLLSSSTAEKPSLWSDIKQGIRFIVRDRYMPSILIFCALANFGDAIMDAVMVIFLVHTAGLPAGLAGVMVALMGLGGVVGAMLPRLLTRRFGSARAMVLSLAVASPFTLLMPLTAGGAQAAFFVVGGFVYLVGCVVSNVIMATFEQTYVPSHLQARTTSVVTFTVTCMVPLGALTGAAIATVYDPRTAMWVSGLIITLSVGVFLVGPLRRLRDLPDTVREAVPAEA